MDSFIYALVLVPSLDQLLPRSGITPSPATIGYYGGILFAVFLVGWGMALVWGPVADRFGRDLAQTLAWPGSWRLAARHWRSSLAEIRHAVSPASLVAAARRMVPELSRADFLRGPAGVRALRGVSGVRWRRPAGASGPGGWAPPPAGR